MVVGAFVEGEALEAFSTKASTDWA